LLFWMFYGYKLCIHGDGKGEVFCFPGFRMWAFVLICVLVWTFHEEWWEGLHWLLHSIVERWGAASWFFEGGIGAWKGGEAELNDQTFLLLEDVRIDVLLTS